MLARTVALALVGSAAAFSPMMSMETGRRQVDHLLEHREAPIGRSEHRVRTDLHALEVDERGVARVHPPLGLDPQPRRLARHQEEADSGNLVLGETVDLAYVDQSRDALNPDQSVWEAISGGHDEVLIGGQAMNSRQYVSLFNFTGSDQQQKVGTLSGGERNRVHLAQLLKTGGNVVLLDEPTNDLDVETLRALEEAILAFPGAAMVISHDRWFLDRVATHILAYEDDGGVVFHEGNFSDYEEDHRARVGAAADQPKRLKYTRLK